MILLLSSFGSGDRAIAQEFAVAHDGEARGEFFGEGTLVRDHDDGHAEAGANFEKEVHDAFAGGGIEIAGGLVGEKNFWAIDERTGDGGALLFAAGKFGGAMAGALFEFYALKRFGDAGGALGAIDFGEAKRKLDVFRERHAREKIEGLKDHADGVAAVAGKIE